jgi:hypothetical protein
VIIHYDMTTGRKHMIEVRAFDVTEVLPQERPAIRVSYDPRRDPGEDQAFTPTRAVILAPTRASIVGMGSGA